MESGDQPESRQRPSPAPENVPEAIESVEGLYGVEPAAFTAARDALAKRLRTAGDKEEAAKVKALRRPPLTVWALNRVARDAPDVIAGVLDAGAALRQATQAALAGDAGQLRDAQARERRAINAANDAASAMLAASGHAPTDASRQTMERTLRAAIVDEDVAARLRSGTVQSDEAAFGFGTLDTSVPAATDHAATPTGQSDIERRAAEAERERVERSRRAALEDTADRLSRTAERLERKAAEAERQAAEARRQADAAAREATAAREAAAGE
jgi:hypothetical protein